MIKDCQHCKWALWVDNDLVCHNEKSRYLADIVKPEDGCKHYEPRRENYASRFQRDRGYRYKK